MYFSVLSNLAMKIPKSILLLAFEAGTPWIHCSASHRRQAEKKRFGEVLKWVNQSIDGEPESAVDLLTYSVTAPWNRAPKWKNESCSMIMQKKSIRSIHQSVVFLVKYIFVEVQFESTNNAIYSRRIFLRLFLREVSSYRRVSARRSWPDLKHIITAIKFLLEANDDHSKTSSSSTNCRLLRRFFSFAEGRCCSALKWIIYNIKNFQGVQFNLWRIWAGVHCGCSRMKNRIFSAFPFECVIRNSTSFCLKL